MTDKPSVGRVFQEAKLIAQIALAREAPVHFPNPFLSTHSAMLHEAVAAMWADSSVQMRIIDDRRVLMHVYAVPVTKGVGVLLVWDLTPSIRIVSQYRESLAQVYKDMLHATTTGKMLLVEPEEVSDIVSGQTWSYSVTVRSAYDIEACRNLAAEQFQQAQLPPRWKLEFLLGVSEAVTNALKHANGGEFRLIRTERSWIAFMRDRGHGIDYAILPYSTILRGYSTKLSMGLGFSTMFRCLDRIYLCTSDQGVTLLLQKDTPAPAQHTA